MSLLGSNFPGLHDLEQLGVVTVSTSRVVMAKFASRAESGMEGLLHEI